MEKNKYRHSFAHRLTKWVMLVVLVMMSGLAWLIYNVTGSLSVESNCEAFYSSILTSEKSITSMMSNVSVAVDNNIFDIERNLHQPAQLQAIMERIVATNPHIRSCGISFIENYFPQKGRGFCPYAWRKDSVKVEGRPLEGTAATYLDKAWFREAVAADSAYWSEPFFDSRDATTPLAAYQYPVHDASGRVVAIVGADLSLQFMTRLLEEQDSSLASRALAIKILDQKVSDIYVLSRDGTYLTHHDEKRILKGNFYVHVKDADEPGAAAEAIKRMSEGKKSYDEVYHPVRVNRIKSYLFYAPIAGTDWEIVITLPKPSIDIFGILVGSFMLMLIVIVLLVIFLVCHLVIRRAVQPLRALADTADQVAGGQFDAPLPDIKSHDEVHLLRDTFENMQHSLATYVDELKQTTTAKASMESELKIAHDIQMAMLPKTYPAFPNRSDIDIYGQLKPAKAVGGDLYDFLIHDGQLFFCIGDVSGKGVPASLVMAMTRSLFRNISAYTREPAQIAAALNEALSDNNEAGMFVTLLVGVLDLDTGSLSYSNAGHNPPLLLSGDGVSVVDCDANIPAGVMSGWSFSAQHLQLNKGDILFLYTDGLNEAENIHLEQFEMDRMLQVAERSSREPKALVEAMTAAVAQFVGDAEQNDDLTMLAIQYTH